MSSDSQTLYRTNSTEVIRRADGVVKRVSRLDLTICASLQREHAILKQLACPEIPKVVAWNTEAETLDLVLEDIGATSLDRLGGPFDVNTVLTVAVQVCSALIITHRARLVHRDINPRNIVYNAGTQRAQLIDFGIAGQEVSEIGGRQAGTLAYFSPEQTGHTRHPVDHRTDLYALGVVLHQLLSGQLPFAAPDSAALFQQILSAPVPPLEQCAPGTPPLLSALVQRLMHRDPAERYQSASGLQHDLRALLTALQASRAPDFALGSSDRLEALVLPDRLYGSDEHVRQLQQFYARAQQGQQPRIALLRGEAGVGKSSIVNQLHASVHRSHGLLLTGKHDANRRNVPFDSVRQMLAQLTRQVLALPEAEVDTWRRRLQNSLGRGAGALIEVAPELQLLLGKTEPVAPMEPQQTENRLLALLRRLVEALGRSAPTLLFIDDLQWADTGTLKVLNMLADPALAGVPVVLVGAYRNNEVDAAHPLAQCLGGLAELGLAPLQLTIEPLSSTSLEALLGDLFAGSDAAAVAQLAEFIARRTQNNPFYVRELLAHCWRTRLVDFDSRRGGFVWDAAQLAHASVPDSAVGLVMSQIDTLSADDAQLLGWAACLGSLVREEVLQQVSPHPVERPLRTFVQRGLLVPTEEAHALRFAHDRIRQAAYERLPAATVQHNHRALANALQRLYALGTCDIFDLLEQVNAAQDTYTTGAERAQVAEWNTVGAHKARQALGYATAERCLQVALRMLPADLASQDPAAYDSLHSELAINLFMLGRTGEALADLAALLPLSREAMRVASLEALRILMLGSSGRGAEALQSRDRALQALGYDKVLGSKSLVPLNILRLAWQTRAMDGDTFRRAPRCHDPRAILAQRILSLSGLWAHEVSIPEVLANASWSAMLTLREGWTPHSTHAMSGLSLMFAMLHRSQAAARLGAAARTLFQLGETVDWFAADLIVLGWSDALTNKPSDMVLRAQGCYEGARQAGDPVWSGLCVVIILGLDLYVSIDRTLETCERTASLLKGLRNPLQMGMFLAWYSLCLCLTGRTDDKASLVSSELDRESLEAYLGGQHGLSAVASMAISQVMSFVVNGAYDAARAATPRLLATEFWRSAPLSGVAAGLFYTAVALIKGSPADLPLARRLCRRIAQLAKGSAAGLGHGDVQHLQGLLAAAKGDYAAALLHLSAALEWSRRMGYLDRECVTLEATGRVHAQAGHTMQASMFLHQAQAAFATWGARVRAQDLAAELNLAADPAHLGSATTRGASRTTGAYQSADTTAVLQGMAFLTQALSVQELCKQIASTLQRSTGATRAAVLLHAGADFVPTADTAASGPPPSKAVVRLAVNMRRVLLLDDLLQLNEPLPKSLVCLPLMHGEQLLGVLYLENQHIEGAFPTHRREALEQWTSHAAAALAHALLREDRGQAAQQQTEHLRRVYEEKVQRQREATEERMAGGFAHEMRNALSGAGLSLQSLYVPGDPDAVHARLQSLTQTVAGLPGQDATAQALQEELVIAQDLLQNVILGVERANRITNEILAYSQASQALASDSLTQLASVVDRVLQEQAQRLQTCGIHTRVQVEAGLAVSAQESHTTAILRNLVRNAVDALAQDQPVSRDLTVQVTPRGNMLQVQVRDNAAGMPAAVQARVFEPFFSTKGTAGTGLGLGLSRKLARLHGGDLTFESEPGKGTTFSLTLPAGDGAQKTSVPS